MPEQFRIPKKRATPRRGAGFGMEAASFRGRWVTGPDKASMTNCVDPVDKWPVAVSNPS